MYRIYHLKLHLIYGVYAAKRVKCNDARTLWFLPGGQDSVCLLCPVVV
jgi:hypothetical protein